MAQDSWKLGQMLGKVLILGMAVILAYSNTLQVPFLFDDLSGVVENPSIRHLWSWQVIQPPADTTPAGRPLVNLSLALNYAISGLDPWSYHVMNTAIHVANAVLLMCIVGLLARHPVLPEAIRAQPGVFALGAAGLWALHPLATGSVTYIIQRAESLMALGCLGTVFCWAAYRAQPGRKWPAPMAAMFAWWSVACKESAAVLPVVILLLDWVFHPGPLWRRDGWKLHLGVFSSWALLAWLMSGMPRSKSVGFHEAAPGAWDYLLIQVQVIPHYFKLVLWPAELSLDYSWLAVRGLGVVLPHFALLASLGLLCVWGVVRRSPAALCGSLVFVFLAPTSSVVPILTSPAAEHRMLLPLAALAPLAAWLCLTAGRRLDAAWSGRWFSGRWGAVLVAVCAVLLGGLTYLRNQDYQSAERIWLDVLSKQPQNSRAMVNLGKAYYNQKNMAEAEALFRRAVAQSPDYADAHYNLGTVLAMRGAHKEGLFHLRRATEIWPDYAAAYANIGKVKFLMGDREGAKASYREALRHRPAHATANFNLAVFLMEEGQLTEALAHALRVRRSDPNYPRGLDLELELRRRMGTP